MADTCVSNVANNTEETRSDALGMLFVIARAAFFIYLISSSRSSSISAHSSLHLSSRSVSPSFTWSRGTTTRTSVEYALAMTAKRETQLCVAPPPRPNGLAGSTAALLLDHSHVRYEKYR